MSVVRYHTDECRDMSCDNGCLYELPAPQGMAGAYTADDAPYRGAAFHLPAVSPDHAPITATPEEEPPC